MLWIIKRLCSVFFLFDTSVNHNQLFLLIEIENRANYPPLPLCNIKPFCFSLPVTKTFKKFKNLPKTLPLKRYPATVKIK